MITYGSVSEPVAVSGLGIVSVFGNTPDAFRDALLAGRSGIGPVTSFDTTGCRSTIAAEIKGFQPADWVSPMKLPRTERTGVYAIATAVDLLREGRASALVTGGVDVINETFFKAYDRFAVMSPDRVFSNRVAP